MCAKTTLLLIIRVLAQNVEIRSVKFLDSGVKKLYKGVKKKKNGVARSSLPHLNFFYKNIQSVCTIGNIFLILP